MSDFSANPPLDVGQPIHYDYLDSTKPGDWGSPVTGFEIFLFNWIVMWYIICLGFGAGLILT